MGSAGGIHAFVTGQINDHNVQMLVDTGAFCNCLSYTFYRKCLSRTTSLSAKAEDLEFTSTNRSTLDVLGSVRVPVKMGRRSTLTQFYVIEKLSQDVILGVPFLQSTGAVVDFNHKRVSLYNRDVNVPLVTSIDHAKAVRVIKRIRVPANHEVILPVRLPQLPNTLAITENLPNTVGKGIKVASVLVDCNKSTSLCRIANPTNRPVLLPAGYPLAYLNPLPVGDAGMNLIDMSECIDNEKTHKECTSNDEKSRAKYDDECDDKLHSGSGRTLPPHAERLSILHGLGIKIGTDTLNQEQAEKLSQLLYESQDIMAENYMQVPEIRVPRHKIPLTDDRPSI